MRRDGIRNAAIALERKHEVNAPAPHLLFLSVSLSLDCSGTYLVLLYNDESHSYNEVCKRERERERLRKKDR